MKILYLWDGSAFVYRSFFALPPLTTRDGFPTGAIYGFLRALFALIKTEKPQYFVVAFDHPAPTQREKTYSGYKAHRPQMPDPLKLPIPKIKEFLPLMGINVMELEGYEADDIISSITIKALDMGFNVKVYTPDKDMLQLVKNRKVVVINPMNGKVFDEDMVKEKFGIEPALIPDYLALVGDKVDNVEGIKGVGPKTAVKILQTYGSVEGILRRWEEFQSAFPHAEREKLKLSYYLVKLRPLELPIDEQSLTMKTPQVEKLKEELQRLEFKSLLREMEQVYRGHVQKSLF